MAGLIQKAFAISDISLYAVDASLHVERDENACLSRMCAYNEQIRHFLRKFWVKV